MTYYVCEAKPCKARFNERKTNKMKLRQNCKYALIAPTSMGVRITPADHGPVHTADLYSMQATSAESNVLSVSAGLGLPTKVLTAFVKDSPIAAFIKGDLRRRGVDYEGKEFAQGGPWGYRHQFNIADTGYGMRGPRVHNDRAGEVAECSRRTILTSSAFSATKVFRFCICRAWLLRCRNRPSGSALNLPEPRKDTGH